jgi:hypothetical protein
MKNTIIYLLGHFGVGKLTVAKAICTQTGARLFDNHLVNNVIFSLIRTDGKTTLPPEVWDHTGEIRRIAFKAIEALAAPDESYVLTNALTDDPVDRQWYEAALALARRRRSVFLPVELCCDEASHAERVGTPEREKNLKHTDVASALARRSTVRLLPIDHPNFMTLDNSRVAPDEAASIIIDRVRSLVS